MTSGGFETANIPQEPGSELVRAYVWELPVRITHWVTVFSFAVLAVTGLYLHDPYLVTHGPSPFTMANMRFWHVLTGFVFTLSLLWRLYWMFWGNPCARWSAFVPIRRRQWAGMREMVLYYSFFRSRPRHRVGHNALAASTYLFIFFLMVLQCLSGFALYGRVLNRTIVSGLFGWVPMLVDIQYLRLYHYFFTFVLLAFAIHHVYSAALISWEERNGLIESIFTGYKFMPASDLAGEAPCKAETAPPGAAADRDRTAEVPPAG